MHLDIRCHATFDTPILYASPSYLQIKELGCKAGVVLNPGTPLSAVEYVLDIADLVLVMTVNPGFGGQQFLPSQIRKVEALRDLCDELGVNPWIQVDGGIVPGNAWRVIEAGANALVSGSGVFGSQDYAKGEGAMGMRKVYAGPGLGHFDFLSGKYRWQPASWRITKRRKNE